MILALLTYIALSAAGVISAPAFGKAAASGSSGSKVGNFFKTLWQGIKDVFAVKRGKNGELDFSGTSYAQEEAANKALEDALKNEDGGFILNPYGNTKIDGPINNGVGTTSFDTPSGTSALSSATTTPDAGSVAAHIENTENGGSGLDVSNTTSWIKEILAQLGFSGLFGGNKEPSWLGYDDIIADERKYGQGMINDARRWQEYMSGTAYQRTFKDIEAAGYNPWLALQSGSLSPSSWGSVDTGSALGSVSTSLSQSLSNSNSNSSSAIIVALIMMIARIMMS